MPKVRVSSVEGFKFRQHLQAGAHELLVDEPKAYGGDDAGPDPYALLLGALGACTSMTIKIYADRHGIPVTGVEVELSHERIHAKDCENCEQTGGMIEQVHRKIRIRGELTDAQLAKLKEIAAKCPVHKTLRGTFGVVDQIERG